MEQTTVVGGQTLQSGNILATINNGGKGDKVGSNDLNVTEQDIFVFDVTKTEIDSNKSEATATILFEGADVSLGDKDGDLDALTLISHAPVVTDAGSTFAYTEGDAAKVIDSTLTITDVDDTNIESATITISSGRVSAEDVLSFTTAYGITGAYTASTGVLALTGTATLAEYEEVLESVKYQNTNGNNPDTGDRTITWVVNDGDTNSAGVTSTITVAAVNDAPVVTDAGSTLAYTEGDAATVIDKHLNHHRCR